MSLDWQEMPQGDLNLTTQRKYTLDEARDLLNRHLLSRGFTMLASGEVLSVVEVEKIDPSLIPRVEADDLEDYAPYNFMRVTFDLPLMMVPAKAAEEVKILLSPHAKVTPLLSSRRLLVIDAVINLRDVRNLIYAEQLEEKATGQPRVFPLTYRRAEYVAEQIMVVLGLDPKVVKTPDEMKLETQRIQMQMKLIDKAKDVSKLIKKDGPQVFIAVNHRLNNILVNAPPELMATIERTVRELDVPDGEDAEGEAALELKQYQLAKASPIAVIRALEDFVSLDFRRRLQGDEEAKTLLAIATRADHQKILQVIEKLDTAQPPAVEASQLEEFSATEVVRVRFQLPLSAEVQTLADQLKGLLTPQGKIQTFETSKQLVIVDTAASLISIRDLLATERLAAESLEMPLVFPLKHRRATYVADQVMILLGLDPSARKTSTEMQFEAQRMQMLMQQANQQGRDVSGFGKPTVFIAVNRRQNSLLVNAPPEKIPLIERTIEQIDVPAENGSSTAWGPMSMEKYQTITADTGSVIGALEELGNLDPKTQLQSDATGKVIYAYANVADHATIKKMIDRLDGTGRRPEVRWLPASLPADQVAGSIMALIVAPKKEEKNRRPWWYYRNNEDDDKDDRNDGFRVLPDVENNRLLLWATEGELEEVDNLIKKLSENLETSAGTPRKVRRLESRDPEAVRKLLEQLKSTWPGKNPLEIEAPPAEKKPAEEEDKLTGRGNSRRFWLAQVVGEVEQRQPAAPPIKIAVNDQGEIIIASEDTEALDALQQLIEQLSPAKADFHSFPLRFIHVSDVLFNLKDYFADELAEEEEKRPVAWWERPRAKSEPPPMTLGKRPPLRFIDDVRTNTLIVANANARQLRIIREQIAIYDQPPNPDLYFQRRTEAIKIRYSRADDIADSLKEVYRDLLSSKDKEFKTNEGKSGVTSSREKTYVLGDARDLIRGVESPVLVKFSGALSIGVDEVSNLVIISAREAVLNEIKETIALLDKAAKPDTVVRVHSAKGVLDADDLRKILADTLSEPWIGGRPSGKSKGMKNGRKRSESKKPSN
ncbi:MAG: hypothetical protein GXP28_11980 [Planctomycetes bacterium]|nr:hypothetical protein [Planctomycetota bacterium]